MKEWLEITESRVAFSRRLQLKLIHSKIVLNPVSDDFRHSFRAGG
jgi:hypothetical protein